MKTFREPIWGDEYGIITGYMLEVTYDHELENDINGSKIYPSVDALLKDKEYAKHGYGIFEVKIWKESDHPDKDGIEGWMEHVGFNYELGGAKEGNKIYPSEESCNNNEPYTKKYGVEKVKITKIRVVVENDDEKIIKHSKRFKNE